MWYSAVKGVISVSREKSERKKIDVPRSFWDEFLDKVKEDLPKWVILITELLIRLALEYFR